MICIICKKKETKTTNTLYCNNCYTKKYRKEHQEKKYDYIYRGNKKEAFLRDNFTCQYCGKNKNDISKGCLVIHHIDGRGSNLPASKQNNNLENLITLCTSCHSKIETWKRIIAIRTLKEKGLWSKKFKKCIICGTKKRKYYSKGMCSLCYEKTRKEYKKEWYLRHKIVNY